MADITFYLGADSPHGTAASLVAHLKNSALIRQPESELPAAAMPPVGVDFSMGFREKNGLLFRGLACGCYAGRFCSVTAREVPGGPNHDLWETSLPGVATAAGSLASWPTQKEPSDPTTMSDLLWQLLEPAADNVPLKGLIVIAGETGCGKTTAAKTLALHAIDRAMRQEAKMRAAAEAEATAAGKCLKAPTALDVALPHVVTYEDPIESWFAKSPDDAAAKGFWYTPRQKGVDATSLNGVVGDALRQKPALLYVNEVRTDRDWRSILHFAGTGHLVITTTHAGSLIQAFDKVLSASAATTAAKRNEVATRILGLIHIRLEGKQRIPALWRRVPQGVAGLTQEGLASILPGPPAHARERSTFGRAHFAQSLGFKDLAAKAIEWDIRGE